MDDNYLDKKLKGILESPPDRVPDRSDMLDMQRRLRGMRAGDNGGRSGFPILFWLPLLLLALLSGFFWQKYRGLEGKIQELTQQLSLTGRTDTLIEKQYIYRIDTIYQTVYHYFKNEPAYLTTEQSATPDQPAGVLDANPLFTSFISQRIATSDFDWSLNGHTFSLLEHGPGSGFLSYGRRPLSIAAPVLEATEEEAATVSWPMAPLPPYTLRALPQYNSTKPDLKPLLKDDAIDFRKRQINPIYYFIPVGFQLKTQAGPAVLLQDDLHNISFAMDISGAVALPRQRSLEAGIGLFSLNMESKNPKQAGIFPSPEPNYPQDRLHELKAKFRYQQLYAGLRQGFAWGQKWRPSVALGVAATRPVRQYLNYEFIGPNGEYHLVQDGPKGSFRLNSFRAAFGLDYELNRRFSLSSELLYQYQFDQQELEYLRLRYGALKLGLNYHFQ